MQVGIWKFPVMQVIVPSLRLVVITFLKTFLHAVLVMLLFLLRYSRWRTWPVLPVSWSVSIDDLCSNTTFRMFATNFRTSHHLSRIFLASIPHHFFDKEPGRLQSALVIGVYRCLLLALEANFISRRILMPQRSLFPDLVAWWDLRCCELLASIRQLRLVIYIDQLGLLQSSFPALGGNTELFKLIFATL